MGQTDGTYSVIDADGQKWVWFYTCPYCGEILATRRLVDSMNLDGDDIIGCDPCMRDVSVENACLELLALDGSRA